MLCLYVIARMIQDDTGIMWLHKAILQGNVSVSISELKLRRKSIIRQDNDLNTRCSTIEC